MQKRTMALFQANMRKIDRVKEPSLHVLNEALMALAQDVEDLHGAIQRIEAMLTQRLLR